jgi:hypothetical protein
MAKKTNKAMSLTRLLPRLTFLGIKKAINNNLVYGRYSYIIGLYAGYFTIYYCIVFNSY